MKIRYGRINTTVNLRGHRFPSGSIIRIWETKGAVSIQPLDLPTPYHSALWYIMPDIHLKHINKLNEFEQTAIDLGFLED
jgi:hypothetical protein